MKITLNISENITNNFCECKQFEGTENEKETFIKESISELLQNGARSNVARKASEKYASEAYNNFTDKVTFE